MSKKIGPIERLALRMTIKVMLRELRKAEAERDAKLAELRALLLNEYQQGRLVPAPPPALTRPYTRRSPKLSTADAPIGSAPPSEEGGSMPLTSSPTPKAP